MPEAATNTSLEARSPTARYRSLIEKRCAELGAAQSGQTPPDNEAWLWMDTPHKDFRYPEFPLLPPFESAELYARTLIEPRHPDRVRLGSSLEKLLSESLSSVKASFILTSDPHFPDLHALRERNPSLNIQSFTRDPEEWNDLSRFKVGDGPSAIVLSNPHRLDGFFYPQSFYETLFKKLRSHFPKTPIISEESYNLFSFNSVAPGTLKDFQKIDPNLYLLGSVYPALSPQGPALSWIQGQGPLIHGPRSGLNEEDLSEALRALLAWASRQGATVQEFHRRMLALKQGLREFTEVLNPVFTQKLINVPHWPEAGFFLLLDFSSFIKKVGPASLIDNNLATDLALKTKLGLLPGSAFGRPECLALCYAARPKAMTSAAQRLLRYLLEIKP